MGYWKDKVIPKIKKVFDKNGSKKAAAEACKSFDESKEVISKEFEEKKSELQPKVLEIYEASSTEIKTLVKERSDAAVKKHPTEVTKFLEELVKIDFPGSKLASETFSKVGPTLASGPVLFVLEKVSTFLPAEPESSSKEKEVVIEGGEEEKKEKEVEKVEEEVTAAPPAASVEEEASKA